MDTLRELMTQQRMFMKLLGIGETSIDALREAAIGMVVESAEVLDHYNRAHRSWKLSEDGAVREEMIDTLFYLLEGFVLLGLGPDQIVAAYKDKLSFNIARVLEAGVDREGRELLLLEVKGFAKRQEIDDKYRYCIDLLIEQGYIHPYASWNADPNDVEGNLLGDDDTRFCISPTIYVRSAQDDRRKK